MSWSLTPAGPWSKPVLVLGPSVVPKMTPMDTNFAAVILNDSKRLVGMWRDHEPTGKSVPHLATASDWRDPATYKFSRDDLLFGKKVPEGGNDEDESSGMLRHHHAKNPGGLEDMFLWRDKRGHFHAVFHQMFDCDACTAHAYSADGTEWHYSGTAAPPDTTYSDGTKEVFSHSERPHILFDKDGVTPVALTNGVKIQGRSNDDQSFTLLRPLRRASGEERSSAALSTSHSDDLAGLTDFASALNYKSWVKNTHWMDTKTSVCEWHGVTCDDKSGRVTEISLEHNRLNGTLPVSLGDRLTELTSLNLNGGRPADYQGCEGNDFRRSPLPASFYKMSKLQKVNLEYTCLGGTLADAFHNMTSLTELSLHGNCLSGEIPRSLNHSVNLNTLKLGRNPITGSFPWYLSGLTKAVQLNCNFCALTGVVPDDAFLNWPELEETYWDGNGFTGTLPSSLGTLKKLTRVSFNINQFSGPLPASWAAMPALKDCRIGSDTNLTAYLANYSWIKKTSGNLYDCPLPAYATGGGVCNHVSNCADVTNPCSPVYCKKNKMTTATATAPMAIKQCALQRIGPPAARAATSVLDAFAVFFVEAHRSDPMSGSVNIFDAQKRAWRPAGSLSRGSYSRTNVCATSWQHLAMFAGGTAEPGAPKSDIVDVWNSETDTWSVMHLKQGRDLLACASVGQVTLFAGGSVKIPGQPDTTDSVEIWHHNTQTWTHATLSEPRKKAEAVAVGVYIVFAGGETANASGHTGYSSTIDVYDARYGGSWSVAQMASPRQYFGVAYASGHAFGVAAVAMVAGGFYNDVRLGDVDVFDPSTGRHLDTLANGTVVHPTLGQNRSNLRGLSIGSGGRYAAFGPGNIATAAKTSLDFYDAEAGRWMRGTAHMPIVRQGVASVGNVALFAGTDGYADAVALDGDCSVFATPTLEVVHSVHNFTTPSRGAMVAAPDPVTHEVCFAGGNVFDQPKGSAPSRVVECFSTVAHAVSRTFTLPTGMSGDSTTGGWLDGPKVAFFGAGGGFAVSVALLHDGDWLASLTKAKARGFTACAGTRSTVVCAGGQGNGDSKHDESFSFATDVFVLNADGSLASHNTSHALSVGRKKLSAAAQGDVVGFAMGFSDVNATNGYSTQYDLFNTSDGTWFASGELPSGEGRQYGTALGCGGKLIFAGGQVAGGRSKAVDVYDVQAGAWWPASPQNLALSVARSNLAAACAMDRFAVFGGGQVPGSPAVDILDVETRLWSRAALNFGRGWLSAAGVGDCAVFAGGHPKTGPGSDIDVFCFAGKEL